ncbi:MAG TPA: hypothetical protein VGG46_05580 [Terriglobales bacterium]
MLVNQADSSPVLDQEPAPSSFLSRIFEEKHPLIVIGSDITGSIIVGFTKEFSVA